MGNFGVPSPQRYQPEAILHSPIPIFPANGPTDARSAPIHLARCCTNNNAW